MTFYDALYAVGGPTPFARAADSYVVRAGERIELDAAALWDGDGLHGDLPLQPRDQVVVPAAEVLVTVLGEVNRPGVIPFQHGLTVSDYLLRAAALDGPVPNGDILIVERQVILRLLEGIQRVARSSARSTTPPPPSTTSATGSIPPRSARTRQRSPPRTATSRVVRPRIFR